MSWVLIDDEFYDHPKWRTAPGDSIAMWVAAIAWCNRSEAWDGRIPTTKLAGLVQVRFPKRTIIDLEDRNAMERDGDSHVVHDFAVWQQIAKRKAISDTRREAGRRGAAARWANGNDDDKPDGKCRPSSDAQPPTTNHREQVSGNSTPENTHRAGDNSRRRDILTTYGQLELAAAKARGVAVRSDEKYTKQAITTGDHHPDLDRWMVEYPAAPASAVAAWLTGDTHSMAYYPRTPHLHEVI
jgi:hypothetical protein